MMMTSNFEINKVLKKGHPSFKGCFHVKNLPPFPTKLPTSYIIYNKGHWLSLLIRNENQCFYFDSFGSKIKNKKIIEFLKPYYSSIVYSSQKIQHDKSILCGIYCIAFIKGVNNLKNFKTFIKLFHSKNLFFNDFIVLNCVKF